MTAAEQFTATETGKHPPPERGGVRDPVCGMTVDPESSPHCAEHDDRIYRFCGSRCRERFIAEPSRFLTPAPVAKTSPTASAVQWTCPMHPQIVRSAPGSCPICGMALEPITPAAGDAANPELRGMTRRFWIGVALSLPLVVDRDERACRGAVAGTRGGLGAAGSRDTRGAVVRLAVFRARLGLGAEPPAQHVHPDRTRRRRGLRLQLDRGIAAGGVCGLVSPAGRHGAGLFRAGGGHRHPGVAGASAGIARPRRDRKCHPRAARPCPQNRAPRPRRRRGSRCPARTGRAGRPAAGAAGRKDPGRRRRARRRQHCR